MNLFNHDWSFWVAILGATVVKLFASPYHSVWRALLTVFAAVFSAYFFTNAALDYLNLNPDVYRSPVAAVVALTGEGLMRALIEASVNPQKWFGGVIARWKIK